MMYVILIIILLLVALIKPKNYETFQDYRVLNLKEDPPSKCGSCQYGSNFDYKKQKGNRTYGVPNGCQKIF